MLRERHESVFIEIAESGREDVLDREEEHRDHFPSEWELEEREKKQRERRSLRKKGIQLSEEKERLFDRDAWAKQEDRHYQWLEDEYNGVKHRRPRRRKKATVEK